MGSSRDSTSRPLVGSSKSTVCIVAQRHGEHELHLHAARQIRSSCSVVEPSEVCVEQIVVHSGYIGLFVPFHASTVMYSMK